MLNARKCWFLAAIAVAVLASQCPGEVPAGEPAGSIDALFQQWNRPDSPGCVIGVQARGAAPLTRSYGSADLEDGRPNGEETVFEAGSVSKQFTAAAILLLADRHALALSDDIRHYLPELPAYAAHITIAQLLHHTSGLRDWGTVQAMAGWPRTSRIYTLDEVLAISARQRHLNFPAGTAYSYSNTGYNLLAIIVGRVAKQSLAQFTRSELFAPLGLTHTQWRDDFTRIVSGRAIAYHKEADRYRQEMPFEDVYGQGGLLSTVGDLLRWNEALDRGALGQFVTREMTRQGELSDGSTIPYASGLFVTSYRGAREISHSGATASYRAWLGRYPAEGLSMALLCNASDVNTTAIAHAVADLYLPPAPPPTPAPVFSIEPAHLSALAGLYVSVRSGLWLTLTASGDGLHLPDGGRLDPVAADDFRSADTRYRFSGQRLRVQGGDGSVSDYQRETPWQPRPGEFAAFAGTYRSDEALATHRVWVHDGQLLLSPLDRPSLIVTLKPLSPGTFTTETMGLVHFLGRAGQPATGFELSDPRVNALPFRRIGTALGQVR